jgi:aspartate aminotransferase-like enzyme
MKYLTPGPIQLPKEVLTHISRQPGFHRSEEFKKLLEKVIENLEKIIKGNAIILPGTGTFSIDTMVYNYIKPNDKVLLIDIGEFSKRLGDSLKSRGAIVELITSEIGSLPLPDLIEEKIKIMRKVKAIAMVHNETSIGITNRFIEKIQDIASSYGALLLVDSVSGIPAENINKEIDVIATASHKAFLSIPGASIIYINKNPDNNSNVPPSMDLKKFLKMKPNCETPYTPPINVIAGLEYSTNYILNMGVNNYTKIHEERSRILYNSVKLKPIVNNEIFRSNTVASFYTNHVKEIINDLKEKGYTIANGIGNLSNKAVRIGLMGDIDFHDIKAVSEAINNYVD